MNQFVVEFRGQVVSCLFDVKLLVIDRTNGVSATVRKPKSVFGTGVGEFPRGFPRFRESYPNLFGGDHTQLLMSV